jgi:hypothetical protein
VVTELDAHSPVRSVAWSGDGRSIIAGGDDKRITVWDGANFAQRFQASLAQEKITCVAASPDGRFTAAAGESETAKVIDLGNGSQVATLEVSESKLTCVAFSGDGRFVCAGEEDERFCVWRIPGFTPLGEFPHEHENDVLSVALGPDGRLGASGGRDGRIVIWDIEGRRAINTREAHNDVLSLAFSPNGKYLAAGTNDKGVLVFGVSGAAAVASARPGLPLPPSIAAVMTPRGPPPQTDMFPMGASGKKVGLAVLDFDLRGRLKQTEPDAGRTISSLVLSRIDPNRFELYERSQILQLLQEQKLQMSDIMNDTDKAIQFGKLKGIRYIILGSVDQLGETYFITARIVDCETGRVGLKADATTNLLDHLGPSVDQLLGNMGLVGQ